VESASAFVDGVVAKGATQSSEADDETGRRIADTLASVPHLRAADFERTFNNNLQDLLMVAYLASLTKAQLAIAERLNSTI
jgi:translation initiation factor 3 subunit F